MRTSLIEKDKIRLSLINRLKINRKSIELLQPLNFAQKNEDNKLNTSKKETENVEENSNRKEFQIKTNLFPNKLNEVKTLRLDSDSENSNNNRKGIKKSKIIPLLSERNNKKIKTRIKIKLPIFGTKLTKKYQGRNNDDLYSTSNNKTQTSNRDFERNLDKYKQIFDSVSSRIKTHYKKNKDSFYLNDFSSRNYSPYISSSINTLRSPNKKKYFTSINNKTYLTSSVKKKPQYTVEDYNKTLNKEFNTQELINIENDQIKERLKKFRIKVYNKSPLFNTTEKLNIYLGREFNLDIRNLKKSFNKKYKVYTNSINKIKEIKHKNLFSNNYVFGFNINMDKEYNENDDMYNYKSHFSDMETKDALKTFYNNKAKDKLTKKMNLEKQLIELENKFAYIIEQEKAEQNRLGINYGEINQVIQKKFLYREIYELDRNYKKKKFFDEQAKILYKTRNYIQNKVLRENLKQRTINKFKDITGVHFS